MLAHLSVQNFTLVDALELEFKPGMTVITGETGAGKSILLDALGLTLGDRADADRVRRGCDRADICATFDLQAIPAARQWLQENDLDGGRDCLMRRVVTSEGRSRGYINGQPVPLGQMRELGEKLLELHSQHAHQSLLKKENHRLLLDDFGGITGPALECGRLFQQWQQDQNRFEQQRDNAAEISARVQLLRYQVQELDALSLEQGELDRLEDEQRQLASAGEILQSGQLAVQICDDDEAGVLSTLNRALQELDNVAEPPAALQSARDMLLNAQIQVQEAQAELSRYIDNFELDPQRLQELEERLTSCYNIARKHRVNPETLPELHRDLSFELARLDGSEATLDDLQLQAQRSHTAFLDLAQQLSSKRQQAAGKLQQAVNTQLRNLSMQNARFEVQVFSRPENACTHGIDEVEFLISTNPGQPTRPLARTASGGELSRISLAIQVVAARSSSTPSLVFDEVDVGIGGATADVVGKLLRKLSRQSQVICVTHLAQVASKGDQHLRIHKENSRKSAQSSLCELHGDDKALEIARMLGGTELTENSLAHAREMLALAESE